MIWRHDLVPQYELYKDEIDSAIQSVLISGRYTLATHVNKFEEDFSKYVGSSYAVGVANATDGLILALKLLDIKEGDEIITTPFTAIPTVSAIIASGAKPVFVDICKDTYLIDLDKIGEAITENTKAIMPVHLFGNVVDIKRLKNICGDITIIEDASQAHGSMIDNVKVGAIGDLGVFSFYPTKNLGAIGDGGIIVTNNENYYEKLKLLRMYGMTDYHHIKINGINSRLDELQAAILGVKLRYLDEMNHKRNLIAEKYIHALNTNFFQHQKINDNVFSNYHQFVSYVNFSKRDDLILHLQENNIQTNIYYLLPLHLQKANEYLGYNKGDFPNAEFLCDNVVAFPIYPELSSINLNTILTNINLFTNG